MLTSRAIVHAGAPGISVKLPFTGFLLFCPCALWSSSSLHPFLNALPGRRAQYRRSYILGKCYSEEVSIETCSHVHLSNYLFRAISLLGRLCSSKLLCHNATRLLQTTSRTVAIMVTLPTVMVLSLVTFEAKAMRDILLDMCPDLPPEVSLDSSSISFAVIESLSCSPSWGTS